MVHCFLLFSGDIWLLEVIRGLYLSTCSHGRTDTSVSVPALHGLLFLTLQLRLDIRNVSEAMKWIGTGLMISSSQRPPGGA